MNLRATLTAAWALVTGLAGGWLVLSPWALGGQQAGQPWTSMTQGTVFTGLGLLILGVIGLVASAPPLVRRRRASGVIARAPQAAANGAGQDPSEPDLETTLVALARALTADLESSRPTNRVTATQPAAGRGEDDRP